MRRAWFVLPVVFLWTSVGTAAPERVVSPSGIEAWLLQDFSLPIVSIAFSLGSGSAVDPEGLEGRTRFMVALLDEGAGELDAIAFRRRLEDRAIRLSFSTGRNQISGSVETLRENLDEASRLLGDTLTRPRLDDEAVMRVRQQLEAQRSQLMNRASYVARKAWFELVFGDSAYGRTSYGTAETLAALEVDDLRAVAQQHLSRNDLHIGVAGDMDADTLGRFLDRAFGGLPAHAPPEVTPEPGVFEGQFLHVPMEIGQTEIIFGLPGLERNDPDFFPAFVMNAILGGASPDARLEEEVRTQRGLTYSIYTYLSVTEKAPLLLGVTATRSEEADTTIEVIRNEIAKMAEKGATEEEIETAKLYLTGSFGLSLDSISEIANFLVVMQTENLGIDYLERRNELIEAVTADDVRRVAKRLLNAEQIVWAAVGRTDPFTTN